MGLDLLGLRPPPKPLGPPPPPKNILNISIGEVNPPPAPFRPPSLKNVIV